MKRNTLIFKKSQSLNEFKNSHFITKIEIRKNKKSGKLYFNYLDIDDIVHRGFVTLKGIPKEPIMSLVIFDDGNEAWLLHEKQKPASIIITL